MTEAFERSKIYSEDKLSALRQKIKGVVPKDAIAITVGSYARREASTASDLDHFVLTNTDEQAADWMTGLREVIKSEVEKAPAVGGAFDEIQTRASLLRNIGGNEDSNKTITRRMLFLLEGEWLSNQVGFEALRQEMVGHYVRDSLQDYKIALYLLNDIIRYWRTITVDYEHKTSGVAAKPWAVRKLKLTFSRKLLYAGGLFSVGMTADLTPCRKQQKLEELLAEPALDRIEHICGSTLARPIRESYDRFLSAIEDPNVRAQLDALPRDQASTAPLFRDLNNESHHYTRALLTAFERTFHAAHSIRRAVIF